MLDKTITYTVNLLKNLEDWTELGIHYLLKKELIPFTYIENLTHARNVLDELSPFTIICVTLFIVYIIRKFLNGLINIIKSIDCKQWVISKLEKVIRIEKSYTMFFILLTVGFIFILLSLMLLPLIFITPTKFVLTFSLGSMLVLTSFLFIYGVRGYFEMLFSKHRFWFTVLFAFSIFVGFYLAWEGHYLLSVICLFYQMMCLLNFTFSFIPGGNAITQTIRNIFSYMFISLWKITKGFIV